MPHIPVLLQETIEGLALKEGNTVLDATLGQAGHSLVIGKKIGRLGRLIALDEDGQALKNSQRILTGCPAAKLFIKANFRNLKSALTSRGITALDAVLFDLGLSSDQLEFSGRGFSFYKPVEPLLMTFNDQPTAGDITASNIVNSWQERAIADVLYGYGGERYAFRIARAIVAGRRKKPIRTVGDLLAIINQAVPSRYKKGRLHPATRSFQALRIAVNDELQSLRLGLTDSFSLLNGAGRLAVISFHSLEARIVKNFFKAKQAAGVGQIITKKAIKPKPTEIKKNPRSRSAELRIIEKI